MQINSIVYFFNTSICSPSISSSRENIRKRKFLSNITRFFETSGKKHFKDLSKDCFDLEESMPFNISDKILVRKNKHQIAENYLDSVEKRFPEEIINKRIDIVRILFDMSLCDSQVDYENVFLKYETFKDSDFFILLMFLEVFLPIISIK